MPHTAHSEGRLIDFQVPGEAAADETNTVDTRSPWLQEDDDLHELNRALMGGTTVLRELALDHKFMGPRVGELELVPMGEEGVEITRYAQRVSRSSNPDVWATSVEKTSSMPFKTRVVAEGWDDLLIGTEVEDEKGQVTHRAGGWVENLDGEGRDLDEWVADAFLKSGYDGVVYGFVDGDKRNFGSPAARVEAEARPHCIALRRSDVVSIVLERTPNGKRVKQLAFWQPISQVDVSDPNAWTDETVAAIKVVTAGQKSVDPETGEVVIVPIRVRVYVEEEVTDPGTKAKKNAFVRQEELDGEIKPPDKAKAAELLDVPLVPLYGVRKSPWRGHSPYLRSGRIAESLWNQDSEKGNKVMEQSLAYIFETGLPGEGPTKPSVPALPETAGVRYRGSTEAQAKMTFVEQDPASLEALQDQVDKRKSEIQEAHHQLDTSKEGQAVTATEVRVEHVWASSGLEARVILHEGAWQRILELMSLIGGLDDVGRVGIAHDFGLPSAGMDRNTELYKAGKMVAANYWPEAERHDQIDPKTFNVDLETSREEREEARLDAEPVEAASRELAESLAAGDGTQDSS